MNPIDPDEYQAGALSTMNQNVRNDGLECLVFATMEINGEAGELANKVYKWVWQHHEKDSREMALELGDILWGLAVAADVLGFTLSDIMRMNQEKLQRRYPQGHWTRDDSLARVDAGVPVVRSYEPDLHGDMYSPEVAEQINTALREKFGRNDGHQPTRP